MWAIVQDYIEVHLAQEYPECMLCNLRITRCILEILTMCTSAWSSSCASSRLKQIGKRLDVCKESHNAQDVFWTAMPGPLAIASFPGPIQKIEKGSGNEAIHRKCMLCTGCACFKQQSQASLAMLLFAACFSETLFLWHTNSHSVLSEGACFIGAYDRSTSQSLHSFQLAHQTILDFHSLGSQCQTYLQQTVHKDRYKSPHTVMSLHVVCRWSWAPIFAVLAYN